MILRFIFLSLILAGGAWGNQRVQGSCDQSGHVTVTNSLSSTTKNPASYPTCTVTVYITGSGGTKATLFSDNLGSPTALGNPFTCPSTTCDSFGHWFWYAANGHYDVVLSGGGFSAPYTLGDVLLADPAGVAGGVTAITPGNGLSASSATGNVTLSVLAPVYAASYNFSAQTPGGSLVIGNNSVTFAPVPVGMNGTDLNHWVEVSGGTGTAEACLITGGAGTSGQTSGAIILNCANTHTGAWTVQSTLGGAPEAIQAIASTGGTVVLSATTYTLYAALFVPSNIILVGQGESSIVRLATGAWPASGSGPFYSADLTTPVAITTLNGATNVQFRDFMLDMNGANNSNLTFGTDLGAYNCQNCTVERVHMLAGHHAGIALGFLGSTGFGNRALNNVIQAYGGTVATCTGGIFTQNARTLFSGNYISNTCDEAVVFNSVTGSEGLSVGDTVVQDNTAGANVMLHAEGASQVSFIGDTCRGMAGICFGASTIPGGSPMKDVHFIDCSVDPDASGFPVTGFFLRGGAYTITGVEIAGGHISGVTGWGILADGVGGTPGNMTNVVIHGMQIRNSVAGISLASEVGSGVVAGNALTVISGGTHITAASTGVIISANSTDNAESGTYTFSAPGGASKSTVTGSAADGLWRLGTNIDPNTCATLVDGSKPGYCLDVNAASDVTSILRRSTGGVNMIIWQTGPLGTAPETRAFANLGSVPAASLTVYCSNCTTAATCTSGGSGHMAVSNGTNWTCQ